MPVTARIRNGVAKTNANGKADVTFPVARSNANYSISLAAKKQDAPVILFYSGKDATGFKIHAMDTNGEPVKNVTVDWLVMPEVSS